MKNIKLRKILKLLYNSLVDGNAPYCDEWSLPALQIKTIIKNIDNENKEEIMMYEITENNASLIACFTDSSYRHIPYHKLTTIEKWIKKLLYNKKIREIKMQEERDDLSGKCPTNFKNTK